GEIFREPNPLELIRRPPAQGPITCRQNISVSFLQPPPVPPPRPPVPPPLVIRQRAPPLSTTASLILRERPPRTPAPISSKMIIKKLPSIPVTPRSVIVERYSATPARPRDIIIER
ncbi:unnamed protein product, partial [Rotaria magnacalcarata]